MARTCTICGHVDRLEIDRQLLRGDSIAGISRNFAVSEDSLARHRDKHLGGDVSDVIGAMRAAREEALAQIRSAELETIKEEVVAEVKEGMAARLENAAGFIGQLKEVRAKAASLLDRAEASQDMRAAGTFLKELREQIKLMAELEGKLAAQPQITIINNSEWVELRTLIIGALEPYPAAKEAVVHAIRGQ